MISDQPALAYTQTIPNDREFYDDIMDEDTYRLLHEILDKLDPLDRQVIHMRFFENATYAKISKYFGGVTIERTRQRISVILNRLRGLMFDEQRGPTKPESKVEIRYDWWYYPKSRAEREEKEREWQALYDNYREKFIEDVMMSLYCTLRNTLFHKISSDVYYYNHTLRWLLHEKADKVDESAAMVKASLNKIHKQMRFWNNFYQCDKMYMHLRRDKQYSVRIDNVDYTKLIIDCHSGYGAHFTPDEAIKYQKFVDVFRELVTHEIDTSMCTVCNHFGYDIHIFKYCRCYIYETHASAFYLKNKIMNGLN